MPRGATTLEGLDDDHAAAATGTGMRERLRLTVSGAVGITRLILCRGDVEQVTRSRDVLGAATVGEETVMADAMEAAGQHVDEEAADELVDGERHHLGPFASLGTVDFRLDFDAGIVARDEPAAC